MTTERMLKRKITIAWEPALPQVRKYDWKTLTSWGNARGCRLFVEAVVSCALRPDSVLQQEAQSWITQEKSNPLVHAALLRYATYSEGNRQGVLRFVDEMEISWSNEALTLWRQMREKVPSWDQITKACGAKKWKNLPPVNQPHLFDACLRVMEDPDNDSLPRIFEEVLAHPELDQMPDLKNFIVETTSTEKLLAVVAQHARILLDELVDGLTNSAMSYLYFGDEQDDYRRRLGELSSALVAELSGLPPEKRSDIALRFSTFNKPWVFALGVEIAHHIPDPEEVSKFLGRCWNERFSIRSYGFEEQELEEHLREAVLRLPLSGKIQFTRTVLQEGRPHNLTSLRSFLGDETFSEFVATPDEYATLLSEMIESKGLGWKFITEYLHEVGLNEDLITRWTQSKGSSFSIKTRDRDGEELLRLHLQLGGSPKPFLLMGNPREVIEVLSSWQRPIHSEDLDEEVVKNILTTDGEKPRENFSPWQNTKLRTLLLKCGFAQETVIRSMLFHSTRWRESDKERLIQKARKVFFPECRENPSLWNALMGMAWDSEQEGPSERLARILTVRESMTPEELERAREVFEQQFVIRVLAQEEVANTLLDIGEQRNLFFKFEHQLESPETWERLFEEENARVRLCTWLVRRYQRPEEHWGFHEESWLKWIKHYGFGSDNRVRRQILKLLGTRNKDTAALAVEILQEQKTAA